MKWTNARGSMRWSPTASGRELGFDPETTLHDVRYGEDVQRPSSSGCSRFRARCRPNTSSADTQARSASGSRRCTSGWAAARSKGVSKPGEIVWSRVFVEDDRLKADIGRAEVVELPREETERRWQITTPQWPIMHAVTYGVTRDQLMARHKANHIQVAYAPDAAGADRALAAKAAMFRELGIEVAVCGDRNGLV